MKKTILLVLVVATFFGCTKEIDNSKENIAIVEQYIQAVEDLNSEGMDDLLADDYIGYGPIYDSTINKEEVLENWKLFSKTLYKSIDYNKSRNIAVTILEGENKGEWVSSWAELTIVYLKDDAEVTLLANTTYMIENGKIIKSYTIYNEADAMRQLGYLFINNN